MDKKQKRKCDQKLKLRLREAGATFPEDDFDTTSSSGTESDGSKRSHRRGHKVRSGATVKKRPVVRTELWPHTIAMEDDGDEVSCDNISLSKFLSCFTYIMTSCEDKKETAGRMVLLHAISLVLEYLPWADARTFHNLVMVKVEQDRISWKGDFKGLADQFIEKRVRQNLKVKASSQRGTPFKSNSGYKSLGKGYGRTEFSGQKPLYSIVCKQWNYGACSFGNRCKRWHCCWSCYEAGKVGEPHKANSHT